MKEQLPAQNPNRSMTKKIATAAVILSLLCVLSAFTCPSERQHLQALPSCLFDLMTAQMNFKLQTMADLGKGIPLPEGITTFDLLQPVYKYHNLIFYSTLESFGKTRSLGFFWIVFPLSTSDLEAYH